MASSSSFKNGVLLILFCTTLCSFSATAAAASLGLVGVTYDANTPGIPPPDRVVAKLRERKVPRVRLLNGDGASISAFTNTGILINLDINATTFMKDLATDASAAALWLKTHVAPSYDRVNITSIAVGYGVLTAFPMNERRLLLPAIKNVYQAWTDFGYRPVPISTAHSASIIPSPFPPSAAEFNKTMARDYIVPLLDFIADWNSTFMIDLYPYDLYHNGTVKGAKLAHATFDFVGEGEALHDKATSQHYLNLFDVLLDATYSAMAKLGYEHIPVMVIGTGWPSTTYEWNTELSALSAAEYNMRLVEHVNSGNGTPMHSRVTTETYIYNLYDDPRRDAETKLYFGIWQNDSESHQKYDLFFKSGAGRVVFIPNKWVFFLILPILLLLLTG